MNHLVRQYYEQGTHVVLVDTGNSYQGLCEMIRRKTNGADGVYFTYTEEKPISFNPFYTDDYVFDVEKKDSIKTLLLTLWKSEDDKVTKTESGELGSAVNAYIERIRADRSIVPSFNTFYEYMRNDYRRELAEREIKVEKSDFNIDNMLTTMRQYYRGGRYDFLLNSTENIDLLGKRFIVFEIDSIKENRELFPVVTIIIMEAFINKMRRLKGVRKQLIVEEAWKALSSANMAESICTRRSTAFVETVSSQMSGRMTAARKATTPQVKRATCSLFFMATRLGTSSPKTSVKKERTMVIRITDRVCTAASAAAVRAYWAANHWDRRPARLSAAKAEPRKPARVMPI